MMISITYIKFRSNPLKSNITTETQIKIYTPPHFLKYYLSTGSSTAGSTGPSTLFQPTEVTSLNTSSDL